MEDRIMEDFLKIFWNWITANIEKIGIILAIISGIGTFIGIIKFFFSPITAFFSYHIEKRKQAKRLRRKKRAERLGKRKNNGRGAVTIRKMVKK